MSLEIFFQREGSAFLFATESLFAVLIIVSGAVCSCFMVTFYVVERHFQWC